MGRHIPGIFPNPQKKRTAGNQNLINQKIEIFYIEIISDFFPPEKIFSSSKNDFRKKSKMFVEIFQNFDNKNQYFGCSKSKIFDQVS